jgi:hypothetical protein
MKEEITWRKSRRSSVQNACVELAVGTERTGVRDSKDPHGPALWFSARSASAFLDAVKDGRLDG